MSRSGRFGVALAVTLLTGSCMTGPSPSLMPASHQPSLPPTAAPSDPVSPPPSPTPTQPPPIGTTWLPATGIGGGLVQDVAHGPAGWVAVGVSCLDDCEGAAAAAWFSADGLTWSTGTVENAARTYIVTVATDGSTWFAAGERFEDDGGSAGLIRTVFWRSTDGLAWSETDSFLLGRCLAGCPWIEDLAAGPGGVILGWAHAVRAERRAAWFSRDGSTWDPIDPTTLGLTPGAYMSSVSVVVVDDRFVLAGSVGDEWRVWSSLDGLDWTQDAVGGPRPYHLELATDGRRVVALANSFPEDRETAVWSSPDARTGWALETQLPIWRPRVAFAANTFFAGGEGAYPDPHLFTSADGRSWTEIGLDVGSCGITGLFGAEDRLLLVGDERCPGIWVNLTPAS